MNKDNLTATKYAELNKEKELLLMYNQALLKENQELKLELSGYRQAILNDKEMLSLKEENEELKKQLEEYIKSDTKLKDELINKRKEYQDTYKDIRIEIKEYKTQQKEFIKYLENEIKKEKDNLEKLCELYKITKENNATYKFAYSYIKKMEEILQNYKEITGDNKK